MRGFIATPTNTEMLGRNLQIAMTLWLLAGYRDRSEKIAELITIDPFKLLPDASVPNVLISPAL
jgi:hypothetical protein